MRIAIAETLDPDGALARWASPDLTALGHEVLPLPTQELAPVLGTRGLSAWILAVTEAFAPDLLMVCPPYDHALSRTWAACRARGVRVVGFAMDEPLFVAPRARPSVRDRYAAAVASFDRLYVSAPDAAAELQRRGLPARWLRWALSPAALDTRTLEPWRLGSPPPSAGDPALAEAAVLVGRPYARRVALLTALARTLGAPVHVFGEGWTRLPPAHTAGLVVHGPLTGPAMYATLAAAGAVITTGDWEASAIAMVKLRLLEAAMCGARQVAQRSPDLDAYFDPAELPRYADLSELEVRVRALLDDHPGARATALAAQRRAQVEHSWRARFAELAADLGLTVADSSPRPSPPSPPAAWVAGICAGASAAERRGAHRLAASLYHAAGDLMGLARVLMGHDPAVSAAYAEQALAERDHQPAATTGLYARVAPVDPALGHVGFLDPTPELEAIRLTALLAARDLDGAFAALDALVARADPDRLVATAAVLVPDGVPAHGPLWHALFSAALAAAPADPALHDEHRERFARAATKS